MAERAAAMSHGERNKISQRGVDESRAQHAVFREAFRAGKCYLCRGALTDFAPNTPCLHWLLHPPGVRKKHNKDVLESRGAFRSQAYLRWVANKEVFARNINDLPDDRGLDKVLDLTIRYRDLEWSFSCAQSDFDGHKASRNSYFPHYHFQMRIGGRHFIGFNEYHLPLRKDEIAFVVAQRERPDLIKGKFPGGEGMSEILNEEMLELIVNMPLEGGAPEAAAFNLSTLIMADEGTTMRGEDIYDMVQRARLAGRTIASEARSLPNVSVMTVVGAGSGVVEVAERSGRGKGRPAEE